MKDAHPIYNAEEERGQEITELAATYEDDEMIERIRSSTELDWAEALGEMNGAMLSLLSTSAIGAEMGNGSAFTSIGMIVLSRFKGHYKSEVEDAALARAEKEFE